MEEVGWPADDTQLELLRQGVRAWNDWRSQNDHDITNLIGADLADAKLAGAELEFAFLANANLAGADLSGANLIGAFLSWANLRGANLTDAKLNMANLWGADLTGADLTRTNLRGAVLVEANLDKTLLSESLVYGVSAWDLKGAPAARNLAITRYVRNNTTTDDLELAHFLYLLLDNEKIRSILDAATSKVVLILGRFTTERKPVLDALRDDLRRRNYLPIVFDFEVPTDRDITETVTLLARLARFVIADLTDPRSIPQEMQAIASDVAVPIQPIVLAGQEPWAMFADLQRKYHWVLEPYEYVDQTGMLRALAEVIAPAEAKRDELTPPVSS